MTEGGIAAMTNVKDLLSPVLLPIELGSLAIAVYSPNSSRATDSENHSSSATFAVTWATTLPSWEMRTVTGSDSVAPPENAGTRSLDGVGNSFSVTFGGVVRIQNVTDALWPGPLPMALGCRATAVYWPSASALGSGFVSHEPPPAGGCAETLATSDPEIAEPV